MHSLEHISLSDNGYPLFTRVMPLLDWTNKLIWSYVLANNLRYSQLYNMGYGSLGEMTNTFVNPKLITKDGFKPAWELESDDERSGRM
jgi:FAD synthetase